MPITSRSEGLFAEACGVLSGGVSSPVRAFGAVGGYPRFIRSGDGSRVVDVDGNSYIDMVMSWGPLLHGHAHPEIVEAVQSSAKLGTSFGAPTEVELRLAEAIRSLVPSMELLRFVNSGTEATMSSLRLARAFTRREAVVKFEGCYHGHLDALLVSAGSGALTHGRPTSSGIGTGASSSTWVLPYNNTARFCDLMEAEGHSVAAVIVEPVAGNMGTVAPLPGFLESLRTETERNGALLIFDEVITGFRVSPHGAQGLFDIRPDMTCLGKVMGGGLPSAAFGGRREIMEMLSPAGPVYQAGTLSGNPIAMAAGCASLDLVGRSDFRALESLAAQLGDGLTDAAHRLHVPVTVNRAASMLSLFFTAGPVVDLDTAQKSSSGAYSSFFWAMLASGVYLPPSQFETWMLSFAHTGADVDQVVLAAEEAFEVVARTPTV